MSDSVSWSSLNSAAQNFLRDQAAGSGQSISGTITVESEGSSVTVTDVPDLG